MSSAKLSSDVWGWRPRFPLSSLAIFATHQPIYRRQAIGRVCKYRCSDPAAKMDARHRLSVSHSFYPVGGKDIHYCDIPHHLVKKYCSVMSSSRQSQFIILSVGIYIAPTDALETVHLKVYAS